MTTTIESARVLAQRVLERGESLELTDDVCALLLRSAREVAVPARDTQKALRSLRTATVLLRKIDRRIRTGSRRLMDARNRASRLAEAGDFEAARQQWEKVLSVSNVPSGE